MGCYTWGSHGEVLGVLRQQQIFKACIGEKQKEEVQKSYPGASSSSSRGAAAVMATVTEEAASLTGDATLPFTAITLPRSSIQVILIASRCCA